MRKDVWLRVLDVNREDPSHWERVIQAVCADRAAHAANATISETARLVSSIVTRLHSCLFYFCIDIVVYITGCS